jgi:hypothetical protein
MSFWEAANRPRSADYDFTLLDIRFDADGKGTGERTVAAKVNTTTRRRPSRSKLRHRAGSTDRRPIE